MSIYTPTEYNATAASPPMNATNMLKSEYGIQKVSREATPLSDLSRVMHINGDGVPLFPDNISGRTYFQDAFATVDSWAATGGTASVSGGRLLMTYSGTSGKIERSFTSFTGKLIRAIIKTNVTGTVNIYGTVGGTSDTLIKSNSVVSGITTPIDAYVSGAVTVLYFTISSPVSGNIIYIDAIYIGSGVYDTYVYDKACCNRSVNNGVLPVQGPRGLGLQLLGAQYLQFDNPVIGTTGTIAFKFKRGTIGTSQTILSNSIGSTSGLLLYINSSNVLRFGISNGSSYGYGNQALSDTTSWHDLVLSFDSTSIIFYIDGVAVETISSPQVMVLATAVLTIGGSSSGFNGLLDDIRYDSRIWTQSDVTRYRNGDDPIDSQQKSVNGVPHAIAVYNSTGYLNAATPMLNTTTGSVGFSGTTDVASGGTLTLPSGSGTYAWIVMTYGATVASATAGSGSAGASVGTASANCRVLVIRLV